MLSSDSDLIKEYLQTKSSTACYTLVTRYQQSVFGMCYRVLKQREEAEEAAQDSFLKFFDSLHKLREPGKFKSWLLSIAYRTAIDMYRRRKRPALDIDTVPDYKTPEDRDPQQLMQSLQKKQWIERLFNTMPALDASILNLYYIEDMPVKEIAVILNQTESNIKIRLMRTRILLKEKLEPLYKSEFQP
ncbi:MAG: sigma-70 family RNA polymerase sigma factor [Cyclobacteriaceae bacterium]|nr:sigma-70 family RNA polymerase sigma factor [Cyclobacteriaceae bacterium]